MYVIGKTRYILPYLKGHCTMLHLPCHFVFTAWKWGAKIPKKTGPLYPLITCESFINFLFGDTQIPGDTKAGRWPYITLAKSGHAIL